MLLALLACASPEPLALAGDAADKSASVAFTGPTTLSGASGYACQIGAAGDVNGDGYADLLVADCAANAVDVHLGSASGLGTTAAVRLSPGATGFGSSLDGGGDVNGDGYDDVIVGSPDAQGGRGCVWVYHGGPSGPDNTNDFRRCGTATTHRQGGHVAMVGDGNGDGYDDVAFAPDYGGAGRLLVHHGSASGIGTTAALSTSTSSFGSTSGKSLRGAGDVNGDGYADLVYGGPYRASNRGVARVYYGSATGFSATANTVYNGVGALMNLGMSVDGAGDVDGDGYDDVLLGAPGETYCDTALSGYGYSVLVYGSAAGLNTADTDTLQGYLGNDANCTMGGWSVAGGGDYDADGLADPLIGQPSMWLWTSGLVGSAKVFLGNATTMPQQTSSLEDHRFQGGNYAGNNVAALGDVNGDGCDDLAFTQGYTRDYAMGPVYQVDVHYGDCGGDDTASTVDPWYPSE